MKKQKYSLGFTLIELIVVISIISILIGIITTNLLNSRQKASSNSTVTSLVADINQHQIKAMTGETEVTGVIVNKGVYFEPTRYTLFSGSQYNPQDQGNFIVPLDDALQFTSITFPNSTILFASVSGEIVGFQNGANSISIRNTLSNEQKTIQMNRYGVITQIQ